MNFNSKLISGLFIKRYKRFFVDVKIGSKVVTAHCPNTGSMLGLLKKNNKVWLTRSDDPNRKLKYTLEIIQDNKSKVGVNTHLTNKIVLCALKLNLINEFKNNTNVKTEVKFNKNTRFDFLINEKKTKTFIEVKNVTLSRKPGIAEFPDAVTERGSKHISELINAKKEGYKSYILFVVQRNDCKYFKIASDIDAKYSKLIKEAVKKKINILCYDCKFSSKGIKLNKPLKILI
jgi:sugar fermentation stimulation protein A